VETTEFCGWGRFLRYATDDKSRAFVVIGPTIPGHLKDRIFYPDAGVCFSTSCIRIPQACVIV
jgi:hypothetical protein